LDGGENSSIKHDHSKYTSGGSNKKLCGWSTEGIRRYNELFCLIVKNRKKELTGQIVQDVKICLNKCHYGDKLLDEIQCKKMWKKRNVTDDKEMYDVERLAAYWNENANDMESSDSD
jgi:hypothetical protein